jgi:hypothetical protein
MPVKKKDSFPNAFLSRQFELFLAVVKNASIAILAILYLFIASGVVVNLHYCMGKRAAVSLGYNHNDGCGKCGMKNTKGCCHDEYKVVKLQDSHQPATNTFNFEASPAEWVLYKTIRPYPAY